MTLGKSCRSWPKNGPKTVSKVLTIKAPAKLGLGLVKFKLWGLLKHSRWLWICRRLSLLLFFFCCLWRLESSQLSLADQEIWKEWIYYSELKLNHQLLIISWKWRLPETSFLLGFGVGLSNMARRAFTNPWRKRNSACIERVKVKKWPKQKKNKKWNLIVRQSSTALPLRLVEQWQLGSDDAVAHLENIILILINLCKLEGSQTVSK